MDPSHSRGDGNPQAMECSEAGAHRLEAWQRLMEERKAVHKKLGGKLNRRPGDLVMNTGEDQRLIRQDKLVLEDSKIVTEFDKYRGNPEFWELPPYLRVRCMPPAYFYPKTYEQRNEIPDVEYVGVPVHVQKEKDLLPRTRDVYESWKNSQYREEKVKQLTRKIATIQPHKPQTDDLIVLGRRCFSGEEFTASQLDDGKRSSHAGGPTLKASSTKFTDDLTKAGAEQSAKVKVSINGVRLENKMPHQRSVRINVYFNYDEGSGKILMQQVLFHNVGQVAIAFSFQKYKRFNLFSDITREEPIAPTNFYFYRRSFVALPKNKHKLPVWLHTECTGTFTEMWEILTEPRLNSVDRILLCLTCHARLAKPDCLRAVEARIQFRAKTTIIKDVIKDFLVPLRYPPKPLEEFTFSQEEWFEAANYEHDMPHKTCRYQYNRAVIEELKRFYKQSRRDCDPEHWNFSIKHLKLLARIQDMLRYVEKKMEQERVAESKRAAQEQARAVAGLEFAAGKICGSKGADKGKKSSSSKDKKKDKGSKGKSGKASKSSKSSAGGKGKKGREEKGGGKGKKVEAAAGPQLGAHPYTDEPSSYGQLHTLLGKLTGPVTIKHKARLKYFHVYSTLCSYVSIICDDISNMEAGGLVAGATSKYPKGASRERERPPSRLVYEQHDDSLIFDKNTYRIPVRRHPFKEKKKPESLAEFAYDDVDHIYATYFGKPLTQKKDAPGGKKSKTSNASKKKSKEKKAPKSKGDKRSKSDVKTKGNKSDRSIRSPEVTFDPFAEVALPERLPPVEDASDSIAEDTPSTVKVANRSGIMYQHNLYVTFYVRLKQAVDALMEICDMYPDDSVSCQLVYDLNGEELEKLETSPAERTKLVERTATYPPQEVCWEVDEGIQSYLVRGVVKPTRQETRTQSLWSILQQYVPVPDTPPEMVPTPEPSVVVEPPVKDVDLQTPWTRADSESSTSEEEGQVELDTASEETKEGGDAVCDEEDLTFLFYYDEGDSQSQLETNIL